MRNRTSMTAVERTDITVHHTEQEGERHDGKETRVDLLVSRHTVRVHNALEVGRELVQLEIRRRRVGLLALQQLHDDGLRSRVTRGLRHGHLEVVDLLDRDPALAHGLQPGRGASVSTPRARYTIDSIRQAQNINLQWQMSSGSGTASKRRKSTSPSSEHPASCAAEKGHGCPPPTRYGSAEPPPDPECAPTPVASH